MIRINLIGGKVKTRRPAGSAQLIAYLALIAAVFGGLYLWHQQQVDQLAAAKKKAIEASDKVESLKRVRQAYEAWQVEKAATDAQTKVFEALQADQIGPSMALQYLSYALTRIDDDPAHQEEAKAQEMAGWNPKWDTRRVWIKSIEFKAGKDNKGTRVAIKGEALDHQDVAEFYRRLESSDIFIGLTSPTQRRKVHEELNIKYIDFGIETDVSYVATANAWKKAEEDSAKAAAQLHDEPVADEPAATDGQAKAEAAPANGAEEVKK